MVFGPVPRSYEQGLPKKVRKAALRSALSLRLAEGDVTVVDSFSVADYKTREVVSVLDALSLGGTGVLIVIDEADEKLQRSARNIPGVTVLLVAGLNVYDVLRHKKLLLTQASVAAIESRLGAAEVAS